MQAHLQLACPFKQCKSHCWVEEASSHKSLAHLGRCQGHLAKRPSAPILPELGLHCSRWTKLQSLSLLRALTGTITIVHYCCDQTHSSTGKGGAVSHILLATESGTPIASALETACVSTAVSQPSDETGASKSAFTVSSHSRG